ncbi:MAG: YbhN family protein [Nitriliruptoraceae bacterium]
MSDSSDEGPRAVGRVLRSPRWWLSGLLLVIAAYAVTLVAVGIGEAQSTFSRIAPLPLAAAAALQVAVVVLWGRVYAASARAVGGSLSVRASLAVSMPAFTLSHTLPGGGWAGNALAVRRLVVLGMSGPGATAAVALGSTISLTTIAALGAVGIVTAFVAGDLPALSLLLAVPALVLLLAIVAGIVAILRSPPTGDRIVAWVTRRHDALAVRVDDWRASLRSVTEDPPDRGQLGAIAAWALLKWLADIASLALVFLALGATPRLSALLVGFGVTQLATAIPVTPGGLGFVEGGMVGAFVTLGYGARLSTSIVLVYRVIATWLPVLAGVPLLLRSPAAGARGRS